MGRAAAVIRWMGNIPPAGCSAGYGWEEMKKVLILGGGIAGIEAAISLGKIRTGGRAIFDVTILSERDFLYVYPLSIWIPTGGTTLDRVCIPLRDLADIHGFKVVTERVEAVDPVERKITTGKGAHRYDYLIIALGAGKLKPKGAEHFLSIYGEPREALLIKERLDRLIAAGRGKIAVGFGGNPLDSSAVRGGPAFEFIFNVDHLLRKRGLRGNFQLTFFAPMESPGARMGANAVAAVRKMFGRLGIETRFGRKIREFRPDGVLLDDETVIDADLTMFIPALDGHPLLRESGLPLNGAGFVTINDYCEVTAPSSFSPSDGTTIYAVGDAAALEGPEWRAKQGHMAEVMARNAVHNMAVQIRGGSKKGYRQHLSILCVMYTENAAAFFYRDRMRTVMLPMPVIGHWLKKGWGTYYRLSKLGRIPRLPYM